MADPTGNRIWVKILAAIAPFAVAALIGWGTLRSDVHHTQRELDQKANREVVQAQYDALLRELQAIRADLAELKRRRP